MRARFTVAAMLIMALVVPVLGEERWEKVTVGSQTITNATLVSATPLDVVFKHNGGYLRARRQELTPPLSTRFPYDKGRADLFLIKQSQARAMDSLQGREDAARASIKKYELEIEKVRLDLRKYRARPGNPDKGRVGMFEHNITQLEKQKLAVEGELTSVLQQRFELQQQIAATPELKPEPVPVSVEPAVVGDTGGDAASKESAPAAQKKKKAPPKKKKK